MDDPVQSLRTFGLFRDVSEDAVARLARAGVQRTYAAREVIIIQDEPTQFTYFILEGSVRVYRVSPQGREQVLACLSAGQCFGTVPIFLHRRHNHATVSAITPAAIHVVPEDTFRRIVAQCPELAQAMLCELATRLDRLTDLVEDLALHTVRGRLARFLLEHAQADDCVARWTQDEIAAHTGTVRAWSTARCAP